MKSVDDSMQSVRSLAPSSNFNCERNLWIAFKRKPPTVFFEAALWYLGNQL